MAGPRWVQNLRDAADRLKMAPLGASDPRSTTSPLLGRNGSSSERRQRIGPWLGGVHAGSDFGHRPPIAQHAVAVQQGLQDGQQSGDTTGVVEVRQGVGAGGSHTEHLGRLFADVGESIEPQGDPEPPCDGHEVNELIC